MIGLGFTLDDAELPAPCRVQPTAGVALVLAPEARAQTARDRLRLQVLCLPGLESFLPLAPHQKYPLQTLVDWTHAEATAVSAALVALRGRVQLSFRATAAKQPGPSPLSCSSGTAWIKHRAQTLLALEQDQTALIDHVTRLAEAYGPVRPCPRQHIVGLDVLVPQARAIEIRDTLARGLAASNPATRDWRASLTGPWPPAAFWQERPPG